MCTHKAKSVQKFPKFHNQFFSAPSAAVLPHCVEGVLNTTSVEVVGHAENADDVYDEVDDDFVDDLPD